MEERRRPVDEEATPVAEGERRLSVTHG